MCKREWDWERKKEKGREREKMYPWKVLSKWNLLSLEKKKKKCRLNFTFFSCNLLPPSFSSLFPYRLFFRSLSQFFFLASFFTLSTSIALSLTLCLFQSLIIFGKVIRDRWYPCAKQQGIIIIQYMPKVNAYPPTITFERVGLFQFSLLLRIEKSLWLFCWSSNSESRSKPQKWPFLGGKKNTFHEKRESEYI